MSWPPSVPERSDENTNSRPSLRTFGWMSLAGAAVAFVPLSSLTSDAGPDVPSALCVLA
jgi:hypothetical protein